MTSLADRLAYDETRSRVVTQTTVQKTTFSDMRLMSEPAADTIVLVAGRTTTDDGYAGMFAWNSTSTAEDDNVDTLKITGVDQGRWVRLATGELSGVTAGSVSGRGLTKLSGGDGAASTVVSSVSAAITELDYGERVINVKATAIGATGDGSTDDGPAISTAWAAGTANVVHVPAGTFRVGSTSGILYPGSQVRVRGLGMDATTLKASSSATYVLSSSGQASDLEISDLTIDGNNQCSAVASLFGAHVHNITFRRVRFTGFNQGFGLYLQDARRVRVIDCVFNSGTPGKGTGIQIATRCNDVLIEGCDFQWLANGVLISAGGTGAVSDTTPARNVRVRGCTFEGGWYALPARYSGTITSVTDTVLTASGASFGAISAYSTVRLMRDMRSGTTTSFGLDQYLIDTNATFTSQAREGDLIRSGTKFAIVSSVDSDSTLTVEGWLSDTDRTTAAPPSSGASYTVYRPIYGRALSNTSTAVTVERWFDYDGNTLTGATLTGYGGALTYEVLPDHGNYSGIHAEYNSRDITVESCVVRRSWSDGISLYGDRSRVVDCDVVDGQDTGITVNGQVGRGQSIITNNRVRHTGIMGIYCSSDDAVVSNNIVSRTTWVNAINTDYLADIVLAGSAVDSSGGTSQNVCGNVCDGEGEALARYGILVSNKRAFVHGNTCRRHTTASGGAGIHVYHDGVAVVAPPFNERIANNDLSGETTAIKQTGISVAGAGVYHYEGSGAPGLYADKGSTYRRTDGGSGTCLYVKESAGTSNSGWVGK